MEMTKHKPKTTGWYWYELPGSWALQPVYVFNDIGMMYTMEPLSHDFNEEEIDGLWLSDASEEALWSDSPILPPNAK